MNEVTQDRNLTVAEDAFKIPGFLKQEPKKETTPEKEEVEKLVM